MNFKFFWLKALKTFQLSSQVGSKQQFWCQLFSTRVIFKLNFFQVNSKKSWNNLNLIIFFCFYEVNFKPTKQKCYPELDILVYLKSVNQFLKKLKVFQLFLELTWKKLIFFSFGSTLSWLELVGSTWVKSSLGQICKIWVNSIQGLDKKFNSIQLGL